MRNIFIIIVAFFSAVSLYSCASLKQNKNNFFTDSRDGKKYKIVKIYEQIWMAENLAYKANNGCFVYEDDESNIGKYGYYYNWETAKNVCPNGYHLPSDKEWEQLAEYINKKNDSGVKESDGNWKNAGQFLKTTDWEDNGTDKYGFAALPGGYILGKISIGKGSTAKWWTSSSESNSYAWFRYLLYDNNILGRSSNDINDSFSIRCVKN